VTLDTYQRLTLSSVPHAIAFKLGMRFLPPELPGLPTPSPSPRGEAGYVVVADDGDWEEQKYQQGKQKGYGDCDDYTWLNLKAKKVVVIAVPHNVKLDDPKELNEAVKELMSYARRRVTDSSFLYPPLTDRKNANIDLNGRSAVVGHDLAKGKL